MSSDLKNQLQEKEMYLNDVIIRQKALEEQLLKLKSRKHHVTNENAQLLQVKRMHVTTRRIVILTSGILSTLRIFVSSEAGNVRKVLIADMFPQKCLRSGLLRQKYIYRHEIKRSSLARLHSMNDVILFSSTKVSPRNCRRPAKNWRARSCTWKSCGNEGRRR